jgi:hypothetical protein
MDTDAVADELYSLPPNEFTACRDTRVKQARADGDRAAAAEIAALRKPTVVGWLANQLSRRHPDEIGPLLELGAALREATAALSGTELRRLSSQRQQLVHAMVRQARVLGQDAGQRITEDVARGLEDTLNAALADPAAAQRLIEARLTDGMAHHGYGGGVTEASSAGPSRSNSSDPPTGSELPAQAPSAEDRQRAEQRSRLERDLGEAWAQARGAADTRDGAATEVDRAQRTRADAEREVTRLRAELEAAQADLQAAEREHDRAQAARGRADLEAQRARKRVTELQSRLDKL